MNVLLHLHRLAYAYVYAVVWKLYLQYLQPPIEILCILPPQESDIFTSHKRKIKLSTDRVEWC